MNRKKWSLFSFGLVLLLCSCVSSVDDEAPDQEGESNTCATAETLCGQTCVDTQSSSSHCGTCDQVCAVTETCTGGVCTCAEDLTLCDASCVDTQTSNEH